MADDKTAALVVALSAQLTRFEKDMKQAGDIADRTASGIEDRFSKLNPFAGTFLGTFAGNFASKGIEKAISFVEDLTKRFSDLRKVADLTQVSLQDVFGIQEAATKSGAPLEDATQGVRNLAVLLDQFKRGEENSLSKLFDFNPHALQGVNRDALTLQQTFGIVSDLVQNADTNIQKLDVAKAAGQTEAMVKFLQLGSKETASLAKAAADAAPDLQRIAESAKAFDEAWDSAVKKIKAFVSENLLSTFKTDLQDIIAILGLAQSLAKPFAGGGGVGEFDALGNSLGPSNAALEDTSKKASSAVEELGKLKAAIQGVVDANKSSPSDRAPSLSAPGGGTSTFDSSRPKTVIPTATKGGGGKELDAFDRTEEQITRHTASVNADTIAVSQNSAVQAQLRAEFQLLNAIRKDEGEVTQAQIDQYTKLRETMSAQQALVAAGIQLNSEHAKSFISVSEGAGAAQAAYTKAADGVAKLNSASQLLGSALSNAFADAVVEGKNLNEVFNSLIKTLEKAAINSLFASFFNQQAGGGLSPFASFLGGIGKNAAGTDNWRGGPTWVGEKGPEIVNLPRGSQVIPNNRLGGGGSSIMNTFMVAGDVSPGTIEQLRAAVMSANKQIAGLSKIVTTTQRMQATGVG